MNLLVTGGAGFIGSTYVRLARRRRPEDLVVNVDALTYAGNLENLRALEGDARHVFVRADIRDGGAMLELMRRHAVDAVVNFAAESHVDRSIVSAEPFLRHQRRRHAAPARVGARGGHPALRADLDGRSLRNTGAGRAPVRRDEPSGPAQPVRCEQGGRRWGS